MGSTGTLAKNPACNSSCHVCHYKDLPYAVQLERKQSWAEDRFCRWKHVLKTIVPAPEPERLAYRSKSWLRSHFQEDGTVSFGWFRRIQVQQKWTHEFVSWDSCPVLSTPIQTMIPRLRQLFSHELSSFARRSLTGIWLGSPHLVVVARDALPAELRRVDWNGILAAPFERVWFHCNPQVESRVFSKKGPIEPINGNLPDGTHPIRAFRQVARSLLAQARAKALESLLQDKPALILDLYCGTGDLSMLLPATTGWVGIERSKEMVNHANGLRPDSDLQQAYAGTVDQRLRDGAFLQKIAQPYALFINPPRPGLGRETRQALLTFLKTNMPTRIVYLSCSASSLARDLEAFETDGFRPRLLQPYDFFPQTEHFETLAVLEKV